MNEQRDSCTALAASRPGRLATQSSYHKARPAKSARDVAGDLVTLAFPAPDRLSPGRDRSPTTRLEEGTLPEISTPWSSEKNADPVVDIASGLPAPPRPRFSYTGVDLVTAGGFGHSFLRAVTGHSPEVLSAPRRLRAPLPLGTKAQIGGDSTLHTRASMLTRDQLLLRALADDGDRALILGREERREILRRLERLEKLEGELKQTQADLRRLAREKAELEERFARYRQRHPETVGVKLGKPYFLRRGPAEPPPVPEHGHPGARAGHAAHLRPPPERIDRRVRLPLTACPRCGGHRLSGVQELRHRLVEEIPLPSTEVTDYTLERRYCRDCRRLVEPTVPGVLPRARLGLRLMHLVAQLKVFHRLPTEQIPPVLQSVYGVHVSEGEVMGILTRLASVYRPTFERFQGAMRDAPAKYLDETGHSVNGDGAYLWVAATPTEAIYRVTPTRGHLGALDLLGATPTGTVVHDRFVAYSQAARKTGLPQQLCWFHLLGDAKELAEFHGAEGEQILRTLRRVYRQAKRWNGRGTEAAVRTLERRLERGLAERPGTSIRCHRFVRHLLSAKAWLFRFVLDGRVEGTNNRAERALRPSVVARKISGGSRSWHGARTMATLTSIVQTLRLRGQMLVADGPAYLAAG